MNANPRAMVGADRDARSRPGWAVCLAVAAAYGAFLVWSAPLADAFQFEGDEGYELMKGYLCSLGHVLYEEIWNDQPPLLTGLLCLLFKFFGPLLIVARVLAVGFAALLA